MKAKFLDERVDYDGSQLRSLFSYERLGLLGDSIVSFVGACNVGPSTMVDLEDLRAGSRICGDEMLHFIIEKFNVNLFSGVCMQRLLASLLQGIVMASKGVQLRRDGDDLYFEDKKLSISVATASPTSILVHFAVNVVTSGTPVPTIGLRDLDLEPVTVARELMRVFVCEVESIEEATQKVKWVR